MIGPRKTLRRGEPTPSQKNQARIRCFDRANGHCEMKLVPECRGWMPLDGDVFLRGQLAHLKAKRRFGWMESEETGQRHLWACQACHAASHNAGGKPVPAKQSVYESPDARPESWAIGGNQ